MGGPSEGADGEGPPQLDRGRLRPLCDVLQVGGWGAAGGQVGSCRLAGGRVGCSIGGRVGCSAGERVECSVGGRVRCCRRTGGLFAMCSLRLASAARLLYITTNNETL